MNEEQAIYRREGLGFVPASALAQEFFEKTKLDAEVELQGKRPRNAAFNRKYFKMVRIVAEGAGIHPDDMLVLVKYALHHYEMVDSPAGGRFPKLRSISFAKMDEQEFENFYNRTLTLIVEKILPGSSIADLESAVLEFG